MRIDVVSIFPEMFDSVTAVGITSRAIERGLWSLKCWNPRDFVENSYRRVEDRPYGGGPGMVMLAEPLAKTLQAISVDQAGRDAPVFLMSPQGRPLTHDRVVELATLDAMTIVAGRYEGVDQRFVDRHVTEAFCIGDFVVSGGELPAMMLVDAVVRLLPGAVNDPDSVVQESFADGLLDCPHYTRPEQFDGTAVPGALMSGDHKRIAAWRRCHALRTTARVRPELIAGLRSQGLLSAQDEAWLAGAEVA
ncbi:MAG: tRNA (guanosine(37)-N1)-methyltransferase TrmD [Burkholderiaceae bacterium]